MNRMEIENRSEKCIDITEDDLTVLLKNGQSLGMLWCVCMSAS